MPQSNAPRREPNEEHSDSSGKKPVEKFLDGPVHVSIWENEGPKGAFRTAAFQLRYRDQQEQWQKGVNHP